MRKTDLTLGAILFGICMFFYYMISKLPPKATIYPIFVTSLLLVLTLIHIGITYRKKQDEEKNPFIGIEKKQLFFVIISSGLYVVMISLLGYVTSTFLYVLVVLIGFNIKKSNSILISVGFTGFIYILFKMILNVPLPTGLLI